MDEATGEGRSTESLPPCRNIHRFMPIKRLTFGRTACNLCAPSRPAEGQARRRRGNLMERTSRFAPSRSEEHTSELPSLMRISYAVFCLKKKKQKNTHHQHNKSTDYNQTQYAC